MKSDALLCKRFSAQQDQLRNRVRITPEQGVLRELRGQLPGSTEIQSQHQIAAFARPAIAGVLAQAWQEWPPPAHEFQSQCRLQTGVGGGICPLAIRIAGGQKGAAVDLKTLVQCAQTGTGLTDLQRAPEAGVSGLHMVKRFPIGLQHIRRKKGGRNCCVCSRKQNPGHGGDF
jgi:hypothetical protein